MLRSLRRAASLAAVVALTGVATPAQSQARPTAPEVSTHDPSETAAPRRRPVRRSERTTTRTRPTPRRAVADTITVPVTPVSSRPEMRAMSAASSVLRMARREQMLRTEAPDWIGIPYRWGGTTRRGIDCSSFVQQFVRSTLGLELPRTTASQRYEGTDVSRSALQPGDLVFFRRRGTRHVGVYLSDGDFVHASSSRGVMISNLDDSSYWNRYYWMSRRIVADAPTGLKAPMGARRDSSAARG